MPQKLRRWIIACGALTLVVAGWAFVIRDIAHEYDRLMAEALERSHTRALILREFADATFSSAALALRQLDTRPGAAGIVLPPDMSLVREVLRRTAHVLPSVIGLAIVDKGGNVVLTTHGAPDVPVTLADRAYFIWHREHASADFLVSAPRPSRVDGRLVIPVSMRIDDGKGGFAGVVLGGLTPAYLDDFMRSLGADSAFIALMDGTIIAGRPPAGLMPAGQARLDPALLQRWRSEPTGSSVIAAGGGSHAAGYAALGPVPALAFVGVDLERELAPWRRETLHRLIAAGAYTALILLLGWVMAAGMRRDQKTATSLRAAWSEAQGARRRAEEADRNKSLFLAHTSHELRTPLNAIIGFSEILAKEVFGPLEARYREYSRDIHHSGQHLLAVVNNILDFAKVSAGHWELARERVALSELLDDIGRFAGPEAALRTLELKRELPSNLPTLYTDWRVLRQVLVNLISNGIKFTPPGGVVGVVASVEADGRLAIAVLDTGIGIAADEIDQVLQPFSNVSDLIARKPGGTGLGLPLCRAFVELLGGTLTITSEPGEGTCVTVRLPAAILTEGPADDLDVSAA